VSIGGEVIFVILGRVICIKEGETPDMLPECPVSSAAMSQ